MLTEAQVRERYSEYICDIPKLNYVREGGSAEQVTIAVVVASTLGAVLGLDEEQVIGDIDAAYEAYGLVNPEAALAWKQQGG